MELQDFFGLVGAPIIVALVEALKRLLAVAPDQPLDKRVSPVLAIALGVAWNALLAREMGQDMAPAVFLGIVTGLLASGLYSSSKAALNR